MPSSKKQEPKIVLDTNVWVSALLWGGKPAAIIEAAENRKITIYTSEEIISELNQVLSYPKLEKIYKNTGIKKEDLIESVLKTAKIIKVTKRVQFIKEHPADDKVLDCALARNADFIISGDKHLLNVDTFRKTKVTSVNEFVELMKIMID